VTGSAGVQEAAGSSVECGSAGVQEWEECGAGAGVRERRECREWRELAGSACESAGSAGVREASG